MVARLRDPFSGISHLVGAVLALIGLSALVVGAARTATAWHIVSFSVYGTTMILLYTSSALYHLLPLSEKGTRVFRLIDHVMIYLLIAGTYTPICLVPLRGAWGWSLFGIVWGLGLAGIVFTLFWLEAPRWVSTSIYLLMGWCCLTAIYPVWKALPAGGLVWLVMGGVFYSIGAVIYARKRPNPWPNVFGFHEIWHLFVLAGTFCHFWMMFRYVLYLP